MADDDDKKSIKDQIREVLGELGLTGKKDEGQGAGDKAPGDLNSQVAEAVRQVREGDEKAKQRAALEERLAALEAAKTTPDPEKVPNERRWIERAMGWVIDGE